MSDRNAPRPEDIPDMTLPEREQTSPVAPGQGVSRETADASSGYAPSDSAQVSAWRKGDRVLAPWEPTFLYAGTIEKIAGEQALIEFDDGDSGWVELVHVERLAVRRGQRVLTRRRMGNAFFEGEVLEVNGTTVRIGFDDGLADEVTTVAALRIPCDSRGRGAEQVAARSFKAFQKHLRSGDRVWALWNNQAFFPGTVTTLHDGQAQIQFDDGDQARVRLDDLFPLDLVVGMFVLGRWKMGGQFYPGTLTEVRGERIHIRYDDGDVEWTVPAALALPISNPSGVPPTNSSPLGSIRNFVVGAVLLGLALLFLRFGCQ